MKKNFIIIDEEEEILERRGEEGKEGRKMEELATICVDSLNPTITQGRIKFDQIHKIVEEIQRETNAIQESDTKLPTKRTRTKPEDQIVQKNKLGVLDKPGYEKIHLRVKGLMSKYKQLNPNNNPNPYQKSRNEFRLKLLQFFLYGGEELRQSNEVLSQDERALLNLNDNKLLEHVKILAIKTETYMFKILNDGLPRMFKREYKDRSYKILSNLRDETNFELRRKIFSERMTPKELATVPEMELYAIEKKQKILENKKTFLSQSTIYQSDLIEQPEEPLITLQQLRSNSEIVVPTKSVVSQEINSKLYTLIQELTKWIGIQQFERYQKRLLEDLPQKESQHLIQNLRHVFEIDINRSKIVQQRL